MPAAPLPANEEARIAALRASGILDTPPVHSFDRVTRLAARLFGTPISLISLVDERRQWFKSRFGFDLPETGRELSLCAFAILQDDVLVIPDATRDPRFEDNRLVIGPPGIRFYAGAPLIVEGHKLGTLNVIDVKPRETFSIDDRNSLRDLAGIVSEELERLRIGALTVDRETQQRRRAETAHQIANAELEAVLLFTAGAVVMVDLQGAIMNWPDSARRMYAYAADEVVGRNVSMLCPDAREAARVDKSVEIALRKGSYRTQTIWRRKDGVEFTAETMLRPLDDETGRIRGYTIVTRDIDARADEDQHLKQAILARDAALKEADRTLNDTVSAITALLRTQARRHVADEAQQPLWDSVRRVTAIARTRRLGPQELVPIARVLRALIDNVCSTIECDARHPREVRLDWPDDLRLASRHATPATLAVLELVSGALRAKPAGAPLDVIAGRERDPIIRIRLVSREGDLTADALESANAFGLQLARALVRQFGGSLLFEGGAERSAISVVLDTRY